jgi:hypothetical protein
MDRNSWGGGARNLVPRCGGRQEVHGYPAYLHTRYDEGAVGLSQRIVGRGLWLDSERERIEFVTATTAWPREDELPT